MNSGAEILQLRLVVLSHYLQVFFCIPGGDRQISSINSNEIGAITVGQRSKSGICSYIQFIYRCYYFIELVGIRQVVSWTVLVQTPWLGVELQTSVMCDGVPLLSTIPLAGYLGWSLFGLKTVTSCDVTTTSLGLASWLPKWLLLQEET